MASQIARHFDYLGKCWHIQTYYSDIDVINFDMSIQEYLVLTVGLSASTGNGLIENPAREWKKCLVMMMK